MSFVITPILYAGYKCLVSRSINAVLPEPTGPAMPIFIYFLSMHFLFSVFMTYTISNTIAHAACCEYQNRGSIHQSFLYLAAGCFALIGLLVAVMKTIIPARFAGSTE